MHVKTVLISDLSKYHILTISGHHCICICCRRAKEKRLTKDAGRSRWGEYFKTLKGSDTVKSNDSDRDSEIDLDFAPCELGEIGGNCRFYKSLERLCQLWLIYVEMPIEM